MEDSCEDGQLNAFLPEAREYSWSRFVQQTQKHELDWRHASEHDDEERVWAGLQSRK